MVVTAIVHKPVKTSTAYVFECDVSPSWTQGRSFGFYSVGWEVKHAQVWDSFFPMLILTQEGGPFTQPAGRTCTIRFEYPVSESLAQFFIRRAKLGWGYTLKVEAPSMLNRVDGPPQPEKDCVLALGDGKDSRMLLGMLRELGYSPFCMLHDRWSSDIPNRRTLPICNVIGERLMASYMEAPRKLYLGMGLDEAMYQPSPWRIYYDMASPGCLRRLSEALRAVGVDTEVMAPLTVATSNMTQRILCERYPRLATGQRSVKAQETTTKNLKVSLLMLMHGIDPSPWCTQNLFRRLLPFWISKERTLAPLDPYANLEARAIAWRLRQHPWLAYARQMIPESWAGDWIDYIHTYVNPKVDSGMLEIMKLYAKPFDEAPLGTYKIPTERSETPC